MYRRTKLIVTSCALAFGLGLTTGAQAAQPQLDLVEKPANRFERSIETHKLELRYRTLIARARKLEVAPAANLLGRGDVADTALKQGIEKLSDRIERAERSARASADSSDFGLAPGVSLATLEAIAACESGGDPTVVDASGTYYGKYQFDLQTWASVGGSGSPAEAPEAEQDYRASLLYSQAGSSPWPVCG